MSYTGFYTKLENVHKDPNSDRLYLATCMQEGVIVGPDSYDGQPVFYFPADGCLDYDFAMKFGLMRKDKDGNPTGGYLDYPSCHIRAIKLRGNRSEGIVIDAAKVLDAYDDMTTFMFGDKVTHIAGHEICKKYVPKRNHAEYGGKPKSYKGRKTGKIIIPDFMMHADTEQLDYNLDAFREGDRLNLSLKMHGTSQRSMRTDAIIKRHGIWGWICHKLHIPEKTKEVYVCGTRRTVIQDFEKGGFYGNDAFRKQHHDKIAPFVRKGMEVFYEVVGYYGPGETDTIMPIGDNTKVGDKAFTKVFGKQSKFVYGCQPGESKMYVYRITDNGREYSPQEIINWCNEAGVDHVPYLFMTDISPMEFITAEGLLKVIDLYFEDLADPVGKTHIKEGVVVRILNRPTWRAYKKKTYEFKVIEGIIKMTSDAPDMEEAEDEFKDPDYKDGGATIE